MSQRTPGFNTLAVHAGAKPDPATGARATPIYQTTAYVFDDADHAASLFGLKAFGNIYTRIMNPTQAVLEERVAALEGGTAALATASGHASADAGVPHDHAAGRQFHSGAAALWRLDQPVRPRFQEFRLGGALGRHRDVASFESQIDDKTRGIFIESLANPGGEFVDIEAIGNIARKHGLPLIVDNTLATPYLVRPIEHGADIVVHSLTKFIGGHGNSMGGMIVDGGTFDWSKSGNYPMLSEPRPGIWRRRAARDLRQFRFRHRLPRARPARFRPGDLALQCLPDPHRLETLPLRMQRHCDNAMNGRRNGCRTTQGRLGVLSRPARRQEPCASEEIFAERRRLGFHLRPEGRLSRPA